MLDRLLGAAQLARHFSSPPPALRSMPPDRLLRDSAWYGFLLAAVGAGSPSGGIDQNRRAAPALVETERALLRKVGSPSATLFLTPRREFLKAQSAKPNYPNRRLKLLANRASRAAPDRIRLATCLCRPRYYWWLCRDQLRRDSLPSRRKNDDKPFRNGR